MAGRARSTLRCLREDLGQAVPPADTPLDEVPHPPPPGRDHPQPHPRLPARRVDVRLRHARARRRPRRAGLVQHDGPHRSRQAPGRFLTRQRRISEQRTLNPLVYASDFRLRTILTCRHIYFRQLLCVRFVPLLAPCSLACFPACGARGRPEGPGSAGGGAGHPRTCSQRRIAGSYCPHTTVPHSEYSTPSTTVLHGVQLWVALPAAHRFIDVVELHRPKP